MWGGPVGTLGSFLRCNVCLSWDVRHFAWISCRWKHHILRHVRCWLLFLPIFRLIPPGFLLAKWSRTSRFLVDTSSLQNALFVLPPRLFIYRSFSRSTLPSLSQWGAFDICIESRSCLCTNRWNYWYNWCALISWVATKDPTSPPRTITLPTEVHMKM